MADTTEKDPSCVPLLLMDTPPLPSRLVECQPSGTPGHHYKCFRSLPGTITVSWTPGDNKIGYWPLSQAFAPRLGSGTYYDKSTSLNVTGLTPPVLSLTFILNPEIASVYYDRIGPMADWELSKNRPAFDDAWMRRLRAELYTLKAVSWGSTVVATTTNHIVGGAMDGSGSFVIDCDETVSDQAAFRNIIVGSISVNCNLQAIQPTTGYEQQPIYGYNKWIYVQGQIAAGFVTINKQENSKYFTGHLLHLGAMPNIAYADRCVSLNDMIGHYPEWTSAVAGTGWPCYGLAVFNGYLDLAGNGVDMQTVSAQNHFGEPGAVFKPPIANPVIFSMSGS